MAFRLEIAFNDPDTNVVYGSDIERDEEVPITATVIDTDTGDEVTDNVTYLWTGPGLEGTLTGRTDQTVFFTADGFAVTDVPRTITITCEATITDITPEASSITLTTLSDLGIDNLDVNMLFTASIDDDDLFDPDNADAVDPDSDVNIYDNMTVHRVTWDEDDRQLQLHRDEDNDAGSMLNYWITDGHRDTKSIYIVLANGTVLEITQFHSASDRWGTWEFNDLDHPHIIGGLNDIVDGQSILLGIGDTGTLLDVTLSVSATINVNVLGELDTSDASFDRTYIRPIIDKINTSFISRLADSTAFNKLEGVSDKPRAAYGVIRFNIPTYEEDDNEQRYRPVIFSVNIEDRIDGVSEFTDTDYIVILQQVSSKSVGVGGRSFSVYSVHSKTTTGFKICYEEGVLPEAFGDNFINPVSNITLTWFARGK